MRERACYSRNVLRTEIKAALASWTAEYTGGVKVYPID